MVITLYFSLFATMVDPFFQKQQAASTPNQTPAQPSVAPAAASVDPKQAEIQTLVQQQQTLQTQYDQYIAVFQNPQITAQQKEEVQKYLQQLSLQYQQITAQLQQLWYTTNHVNKPVNVKPTSGSKVSFRWILIWVWVVFTLLVGWLSAMFYYLIQNPNQLASVGLDPATTRSLLSTFSIIFFALVVFSGMWLLIVNGYKLFSVKNAPKTKYAIWLIVGFFIFVFGIGAGYQTLTMISSLSTSNSVDNTKLVLPYVQFKNGLVALSSDPKIVLLAPSQMAFKLNTDYFNGQILPTLGQASFDSLVLDCGNWQTLNMNMSNAQFDGTCIYFNKGVYNMVLKIAYTNTPTWEKLNKDVPAWTLTFASEISVVPVDSAVTYNDTHTEMSIGKVPSKVRFDASHVFTDLWLANYTVLWDINWDWVMDQQNVSSFTTSYKEAKLYTVAVRFPELNDYVYVFPLRVEQSDVPVCEVLFKAWASNNYLFNLNFLTKGTIQEYQYDVMSEGKSIYTSKSKSPSLQYQLPSSWIYSLKASFITDGAKQWSCESDDISVGAVWYQISYSTQYKNSVSPSFSELPSNWATYISQNTITVWELPTVLQFTIDAVQPNEPWLVKQLLYDGKPVLSTDGITFQLTVDTETPHFVTFIVQNPTSWAKSEKKVQIVTKRDPIIWKLLIKPDIVWTDPFSVTFDASTTTLNDSSDEIIYFTRDFWDGEIKKNLSQSIMQHTYVYDTAKDNGVYSPKITITTKKGLTGTIVTPYPITVKKKIATLHISIDSHPSQIARVGDKVDYSLELNGIPKTITWDFGNWKNLQCANRECVQASTVYITPGRYDIKTTVTYQDKPSIEWTIALQVK